MTDHLAMLAAWCGPDGPGLLTALLLAGLAGGPLHCAPMCGPFVLGQAADGMARIPAARLCAWSRVEAGLLAPYHAGRLLTYAALGAVAGGLGGLPGIVRLAPAMLAAGAALFILLAAQRMLALRLPGTAAPSRMARGVGALARRLPRDGWTGGLLLGGVLGFLPCGLLYAALLAASGSGSPASGALAMAAFGLGTVPALAAVGLAGRVVAGRLARWAPVLLLVNAALLLAAGWRALVA